MALVHIDNLAPGMILSRDVSDRSGRLLLPAGSELVEKHFAIFRMWGVLEAEVEGESAASNPESTPCEEHDPALVAAARDEIERLFVHNDPEHPTVKELMQICIARKVPRAS